MAIWQSGNALREKSATEKMGRLTTARNVPSDDNSERAESVVTTARENDSSIVGGSNVRETAAAPLPHAALHGRIRFETALESVRAQFVAMGAATGAMVRDAAHALMTGNDALAASVVARDREVDELDRAIEAEALLLLATQQPVVASDLRFLATILKAITDLERIGDHAVNIAQVARRLIKAREPFDPGLADVAWFAATADQMIADTLRAFATRDLALAQTVIERDDEADIFYKETQRELRRRMQDEPETVVQGSHLLFVAHYLERVCDHCANIAERLAYLETGQPSRAPKGAVVL